MSLRTRITIDLFLPISEKQSWFSRPQKKMALKALELIDMRLHKGMHPRVGAVDATPFIPVRNMGMQEAVKAAHRFGHFLGQLGIPVYYYGAADVSHAKARAKAGSGKLTQELLGEYENLAVILQDPTWPPGDGPTTFKPESGAATVGARSHLICFNVNLQTTDLSVARRIAKLIRFSSGGYRDVQAMGLPLVSRGTGSGFHDDNHRCPDTFAPAFRNGSLRSCATRSLCVRNRDQWPNTSECS